MAEDRLARLGLWCVSGLTRAKIADRERTFGSVAAALPALKGARELAAQSIEAAERLGAEILLPGDAGWPAAVDAVDAPPGALFVWGRLPSRLGVAIVGSRHATASGLGFARDLAAELASEGWPIVSGGALGIDGAAHAGALASGRTVAVLGSGLDQLYPAQHADLFRRIAVGGGAVVSEFPFGTPPWQGLFPRRNRLIAALSQAVVVVEAAQRSGSLGTARLATRLGRTLLAVPGTPGQATAEGTNGLLKSGQALVCTGAADVRRALDLDVAKPKPSRPPRGRKAELGDVALDRFHQLLGLTPRPLDEVAAAAGMSAAESASAATRLELLGLAERAPGGGIYRPRSKTGGA